MRNIFTRTKKYSDIEPDEIFLDASNLPLFDTHQFEGRIEQPIRKTTLYFLGGVGLLILGALLGKTWMLQMVHGKEYLALSEENRLDQTTIFANRGVLYDRTGELLVWNESGEDEFSIRSYIQKEGFAHVLGYATVPLKDKYGKYFKYSYEGIAGAEKLFDHTLSGENGVKIFETNAKGDTQSEYIISPARDGANITLSIDARVEEKLYSIIKSVVTERGFTGGAGVLMDVQTGEILALVSYPEYDNSALSHRESAKINALLLRNDKPFLNRAVSGLYSPGSIIKPYIASGALEEGVITPSTIIHSSGKLIVPNPYVPSQPSVYSDWGPPAFGDNDVTRALAYSSNVFFLTVGGGTPTFPGLGIERVEKYVRKFGFGTPAGFPLSDEAVGTIPNPAWKQEVFGTPWRLGDTYLTSIGQYGFQVSPLQVVRAVAAVASGKLVTPILEKDKTPEYSEFDISEETLKVVRRGMLRSTLEGTDKGLNVSYVKVAGKTGTAELGVSKATVNSWVTGYFPYENPRYAFVVLMEKGPRANNIGGVFVMRQLLDWMHLNTPEYLEIEKKTE